MKKYSTIFRMALAAMAAAALQPASAWACSACFGKSDSAMAQGMNWGIFSLLAVIGVVLGGVTSFFVYLGKRSGSSTSEQDSSKPKL